MYCTEYYYSYYYYYYNCCYWGHSLTENTEPEKSEGQKLRQTAALFSVKHVIVSFWSLRLRRLVKTDVQYGGSDRRFSRASFGHLLVFYPGGQAQEPCHI